MKITARETLGAGERETLLRLLVHTDWGLTVLSETLAPRMLDKDPNRIEGHALVRCRHDKDTLGSGRPALKCTEIQRVIPQVFGG